MPTPSESAPPQVQGFETINPALSWMVNNFSNYLDRLPDTQFGSELYPRQIETLQKLLTFMEGCDAAGNDITGYFDLTTGFGKTWLMRAIAEGVGIGRTMPNGASARGILLAPTTAILDDLTAAFDKAPFRTTQWFGRQKNPGGDMVIISDDGFRALDDAERIMLLQNRHIKMLDETHTKLGPQIRRAVEASTTGRITLGFSGTVDYHANKRTRHLLGTEIDRYTTLQAIEDGNLRPLQLFALDTGVSTPKHGGKKGETSLRKNNARNQLILDIVSFAVEDGRQGLVSCIDGEDCTHADMLAKAASQLEIFDQAKNDNRKIVARAVHRYNPRAENKKTITDYRAGKVDVIFHHGMLGMGFHSKRTDFIVNGRPYGSPVDSAQHLGRVLEPESNEHNNRHGLVFELIDQDEERRVLSFDILGIERINDGSTVIGRPRGHTAGRPGKTHTSSPRPEATQLPPTLATRAAKFSGRLIRELFVEGKKQPEAVPENMAAITNSQIATVVPDEKWINAVLDAHAIDRRRYNRTWYANDEDLATYTSEEIHLPEFLTCPRVTLTEAAKRLGISRADLSRYIQENNIVTLAVPGTIKTGNPTLIPEVELARINPAFYSVVSFDPTIDAPIAPIHDQYNLRSSRIRAFCTRRVIDGIPQPIPLYLRSVGDKTVLCVNILYAPVLTRHFESRVPENAVRMSDLHAASGGLALKELRQLLTENGIMRYLETAYSPDTNDEIGPPIQYLPRDIGRAALRLVTKEDGTHEEPIATIPDTPQEHQKPAAPQQEQRQAPPEARDPDNMYSIPSLGIVDIRKPLLVPQIAILTKKTTEEITAAIKALPWNPGIKKITGRDARVTYQLGGTSLEQVLIQLAGLTLQDAAHRLNVPALLIANTVNDKLYEKPNPDQRLTPQEWRLLLRKFPYPPPKWRSLQEAADASGQFYLRARNFVNHFGGDIQNYYDANGIQQAYISPFFFDLLEAQSRVQDFPKAPGSSPHNWITISRRLGGINIQEFNRWAAEHGYRIGDLYRTTHEGELLALPHFPGELVSQFERYRQQRSPRKRPPS